MMLPIVALVLGLALLVWSADRFVDGASATARLFGMPPLLIGMLVIGFGTSAPEILVSAMAALNGNPGIALGNAYGSNISNIGLILGLTALLSPIAVHAQVFRKELPLLIVVTVLSAFLLYDASLSRHEAWILLAAFAVFIVWSVYDGLRAKQGDEDSDVAEMPMAKALLWLVFGLVVLVLASRLMVWGAVEIATAFGIDDLIIGLTIVAIGTSLPELASALVAVRRGEHDLALGNVIGSNMFNTLAVVGIGGAIAPMQVAPEIFSRDIMVMSGLTLAILLMGMQWRGQRRINRYEGALLLSCFLAYNGYLIYGVMQNTMVSS